jgi:hypothetical protein
MAIKEDREMMARDRERRRAEAREQKLCRCGAVGTLEGHSDWCDAAAEFNPPNSKEREISKGRGPKLPPLTSDEQTK